MLRRVASIFDPIGLVAPFTLKGKLLLQESNELNTDFDHPHPEDLTERIKHWQGSMEGLSQVRVARCTSTTELENCLTDLIVFCDASCEGYGAVVYVRR